jgi:hypothetical protein
MPLPPARLAPAPDPQPVDSVVLEEPWSDVQRRAGKLTSHADGSLSVDAVRWGFTEQGASTNEWSGIFADARLDPKHVKNVYLGIKPFKPKALAAHSVLIFEMDENHPITNSKGEKESALVLSMEAKLAQGEQYGLGKTLSGKYGVVYQLQTWTDLMQKTGRREGLNQILYKLELNQEQRTALVEKSLAEACKPRQDDRYHLFTNSCHSAVIDLVNSVAEENRQMARWLLPKVYNPMALFPAQGDLIFYGQQLLAAQDRVIVQPDSAMHPDKMYVQGAVARTLRQASGSSLWTPACVVAGAVGGALAGLAVNGLPSLLTVPVLAGAGAGLGKLLADTAELRTHSSFVSNEQALQMSPSQAFAVSTPQTKP